MRKFFRENPNGGIALALIGTVLVLFGKALFSRDLLISPIGGDLANQFFAWREFGFSELKKGHLVLWNPYTFGGSPYFAGFQSALLYPPNWLFMLFPLVFSLNFSMAFHLFLSGFFMNLWLEKHRMGFAPRLFGAFVYMFGGAYFLHVAYGHLSNLCTMAWIPLAFLILENILDDPSLKWVLSGAIVFSMELLAGHVQYFVYTLLIGALYALAHLLQDQNFRIKKISYGLAMILVTLAVTAVQWLPGLEAARENIRMTPPTRDLQLFYSMNPLSLLSVFSSGLNGNPDHFSCWAGIQIWWEKSLYLGGVVFLLAVFGLVQNRPEKTYILLGLAILALLLALGFYTPLYPLLYEWAPEFKSFRGSYKFNIFFQLVFSFLAAKGTEDFLSQRRLKSWPAWVSFLLAGGLLLSACGIYQKFEFAGFSAIQQWNLLPPISLQFPESQFQMGAVQFRNLTRASVLFLFFGAIWMMARPRLSFRYALLLLGMGNLWFFAQSNMSFFNSRDLLAKYNAAEKSLNPALGSNRVYWVDEGDRSLFLRDPDIWGNDPSRPERYALFMTYLNGSFQYERPFLTPLKEKLTRLSFIISDKEDYFKTGGLPYRFIGDNRVGLFLDPLSDNTLPRAFLVGRWEKMRDPGQPLEFLDKADFDPAREVLLENNPEPIPEENPSPSPVTLTDITTDQVEVQTQTDRPQILLFLENYSRGWKAVACPDSDQKKYEVMPGDYAFRAIPLAAGKHHFYLEYEPASFVIGKWLSVFSGLVFMAAWYWIRIKKQQPALLFPKKRRSG